MILRKHIVPNKKANTKQLRCSISKQPTDLKEELYQRQNLQGSIGTPGKIQLSKITEKTLKFPLQASNSSQSITDDVQKLINKNRLTIDLVGQETPSTNQLPEVATFQKMKNLLVPSPLYRQYSQIVMKQGETRSLLDKLELQYDMTAAKIRIHRQSATKVRNNRFESNDLEKALEKADYREIRPLKERFSHANIPKIYHSLNKKESEKGYRLTGLLNKNGWKLKDFYSHIENETEEENSRVLKLKQRQEIINKLKKINEQCQVLEKNKNQIEKSIDVFAKYHESLTQKLMKRHKKINKVYYFEHY